MVELKIYQTKLFSVLDVRDDGKRLRKLTDYKVFGSGDNREVNKNVTASLTNHGCCVRANSIKPEVLQRTRKVLTSFAKTLISKYDELDDEFVDVDCNDMHIERMPRIGRGKHNIHFDPLLSKQHCAVADLARESCFSETLSMYMGKLCTLREAGISLTRPINDKITEDNQTCTDEDNNDTADIEIVTKGKAMTGEGMEWHSDGAAGEATVLMSVDDIDESMGSLRVVPGSHKRYVAGIGHDEVRRICSVMVV